MTHLKSDVWDASIASTGIAWPSGCSQRSSVVQNSLGALSRSRAKEVDAEMPSLQP